jgi:hypothetical protein
MGTEITLDLLEEKAKAIISLNTFSFDEALRLTSTSKNISEKVDSPSVVANWLNAFLITPFGQQTNEVLMSIDPSLSMDITQDNDGTQLTRGAFQVFEKVCNLYAPN